MAITLANEISYNNNDTNIKNTSLEKYGNENNKVIRYKNTGTGVYFYDSKTETNSKNNITTMDSFLKDNNFITCGDNYSKDKDICLKCVTCYNCASDTLCVSCQQCTDCTGCESCQACTACETCKTCQTCDANTACASCNSCQPCNGCYSDCYSYD